MRVQVVESFSSGKYHIDLGLSQDGMTLMVGPGPIVIQGVEYDGSEAFEFTATSHPTETIGVCGYLVRVVADGSLDLLVDQVGGDFPISRYEFESGGLYERLSLLFSFRVPPNVMSLDDVDVVLYKSLIDPQPGA